MSVFRLYFLSKNTTQTYFCGCLLKLWEEYFMLFSYDDCAKQYGNNYQIEKAVESNKLYKIAPGIYSDKERVSELELIAFKYPTAIFTLNSAFYYHGLTDVIPEKYYLATSKDSYKITNPNIKQVFHRDDKLKIGMTTINYQNVSIATYDQERLLIELVRNKTKLPFDYYKEVIESYRKRIDVLDIEKLQDYISQFPKQNHIWESIELEVM